MNFDHYVYPGTDILRNNFGITDKQAAYDFERRISSERAGVLQKQGITGKFDAAHLKAIHKFVFGDIYDWAGEFRDIQIFKGLTEFTVPEKIQSELDLLCADIRDKNYFREQKRNDRNLGCMEDFNEAKLTMEDLFLMTLFDIWSNLLAEDATD